LNLYKIRNKVPGIALRTTLLTGHPGETEKDFKELKEFVKNQNLKDLEFFLFT
jgi:ribosomal protein S12 methylthiotransferase